MKPILKKIAKKFLARIKQICDMKTQAEKN